MSKLSTGMARLSMLARYGLEIEKKPWGYMRIDICMYNSRRRVFKASGLQQEEQVGDWLKAEDEESSEGKGER